MVRDGVELRAAGGQPARRGGEAGAPRRDRAGEDLAVISTSS